MPLSFLFGLSQGGCIWSFLQLVFTICAKKELTWKKENLTVLRHPIYTPIISDTFNSSLNSRRKILGTSTWQVVKRESLQVFSFLILCLLMCVSSCAKPNTYSHQQAGLADKLSLQFDFSPAVLSCRRPSFNHGFQKLLFPKSDFSHNSSSLRVTWVGIASLYPPHTYWSTG